MKKNDVEQLQTSIETRAESARVESGFETLDPDATKTAFEGLDAILYDLAKQFINTLDEMVRYLDRMQALLSQRGTARKKSRNQAGLLFWTGYASKYTKKLNCSLCTIEDHIAEFRRNRKSGPSREKKTAPHSKPLRLHARKQAALVQAQLAGNDMVAALKSGGD